MKTSQKGKRKKERKKKFGIVPSKRFITLLLLLHGFPRCKFIYLIIHGIPQRNKPISVGPPRVLTKRTHLDSLIKNLSIDNALLFCVNDHTNSPCIFIEFIMREFTNFDTVRKKEMLTQLVLSNDNTRLEYLIR